MPTYVYKDCRWCGDGEETFELNVPVSERDSQWCEACGLPYERKMSFSGLAWSPTRNGGFS